MQSQNVWASIAVDASADSESLAVCGESESLGGAESLGVAE